MGKSPFRKMVVTKNRLCSLIVLGMVYVSDVYWGIGPASISEDAATYL